MKTILFIGTLLAIAAIAGAEPEGKDPFFPAGPKPPVKESLPQDRDWGRDPFNRPFEGKALPATQQGNRSPGSSLSGIIYGTNVRLAIFGGETVREGSMVGGQRLLAIHKRSVVLMNTEGRREEVFLEDFSIRRK
jgi:hypothetical protein